MHRLERILECLWLFTSGIEGIHQPTRGYILRVGQEVWLIDPPGDLAKTFIERHFPGLQVTRLFITHVQEEHIAGVVHFPGASIHVPAGDAYLCRGVDSYIRHVPAWEDPWEWKSRGNFSGNLAGARNERPAMEVLRLAEPLCSGEKFLDFDVISTPGHGKHAVSLVLNIEGLKVAFCGDVLCGPGRIWNWFDCDWDYGLEMGQCSLVLSCRALAKLDLDVLCPAHGEVMNAPWAALERTGNGIESVLCAPQDPPPVAIDFPDNDFPIEGWRQITPHIFQWKTGNNILVTADSGKAVLIDNGLCIWKPLAERTAEHDSVFRRIKEALGIQRIEWIVPTHYHGDHIEFIPRLAEQERARVICLESVAGPMEFPDRYNLACSLPFYDSICKRIEIHEKVPEDFVLEWEGCHFRFFRLGGQTGYHLGLDTLIDGKRILFAGDSFWGTNTIASPVLTWNDASPTEKGWVFALRRMIECRPEILVCGHGSALKNPMPYLEASFASWVVRLERFRSLNPHRSWEPFFSPFSGEPGG